MGMPRSRSKSMESMMRSPRPWMLRWTWVWRNMGSTSVVLPWSTWAMMATLRMGCFSSIRVVYRITSTRKCPGEGDGSRLTSTGRPIEEGADDGGDPDHDEKIRDEIGVHHHQGPENE